MQRVLVIDSNKKALMPCLPVRARILLAAGKAAVYRLYPFAIILTDRVGGNVQPVELKVDPGSKTTGIALVAEFQNQKEVVFAANLNHRGRAIKDALDSRRASRRSRRNRKTRYRQPRFDNRRRPDGWLPPSLMSRVDNIETWLKRLSFYAGITSIAVETVRFDMQKMDNAEVSGVEYQQGELAGYEVREYLLEKFNRTCVYCGRQDVPLEVEHIQPKSKGGTNRVSNLAIACNPCNVKKGNRSIEEFLKGKPETLNKITRQLKSPLKDAAMVNATRYATGAALKSSGLPTTFWSGGRTKFNRIKQGYVKDHWVDAACVGVSGESVKISEGFKPLTITAQGRGSRQMCKVNKYGFPRTKPKSVKVVRGFQTGDIVRAVVPIGKNKGSHVGRVSIRATGSFDIKTNSDILSGVNYKYCKCLQKIDGYGYA